MKQKKLFFCRPAYIFFIILLMMHVLTINAYYFYDNFGDNVILTSPWTEKFYSRGSENLDPDPALEFKSEAGGQLLISGTRDANGGWMGDGIMQGPFNASADKPFGVQIDIASFNPGSGRSEIEIYEVCCLEDTC